MSKPLIGLLLGTVLGFVDGLTAWFTPEVRPMLQGILIGSSAKGLIVGLLTGFFARKYLSLQKCVIFGAAMGFIFAFIIAAMPDESGNHYWFQILLPGTVVGAIVGVLTQKMGTPAASARP